MPGQPGWRVGYCLVLFSFAFQYLCSYPLMGAVLGSSMVPGEVIAFLVSTA